MTANQIAFKSAQETERHNRVQEELTAQQTSENVRHNVASEQLSKYSTDTSREHYERSDQASLISANASAINAQAAATNAATNKSKYQMEYDIEYGWTGSSGYPQGMPLSAQQKNLNIEMLVGSPDSQVPSIVQSYELKEAQVAQEKAKAVQSYATSFNQIMSGIFGKGGLMSVTENVSGDKSFSRSEVSPSGNYYVDYETGTAVALRD